ncbi:MAG: lipoprotein signal peptidase [Bacteroidota bacterium]
MQEDQTLTAESLSEKKVPLIKWILPLVIIAFVIFIDQYLKYWVKHNMVMHTEKPIIGNWFLFHFTENNGMAFGIEFAGKYGKLILSTFRIAVAIFGFWYLFNAIRKHQNTGFLVCVALILAGAIGNIIDCLFYGVWYQHMNEYEGGYLFGRVVDMLYFPIIETHYPSWFPFKAGQSFTFFSPVFNLADAAISTGVISIIIFQKRYFKKEHITENVSNFEVTTEADNNSLPNDETAKSETEA